VQHSGDADVGAKVLGIGAMVVSVSAAAWATQPTAKGHPGA
jgi:hypothetical protein